MAKVNSARVICGGGPNEGEGGQNDKARGKSEFLKLGLNSGKKNEKEGKKRLTLKGTGKDKKGD